MLGGAAMWVGVWARDYYGPEVQNNIGANPPIDRYTIWHDLSEHTDSYEYASAVDWVNPVGDGAILNMSGSFRFLWEGHFTTGSPLAPVEGVLARFDASSGDFSSHFGREPLKTQRRATPCRGSLW
jgi:hypothetical protein